MLSFSKFYHLINGVKKVITCCFFACFFTNKKQFNALMIYFVFCCAEDSVAKNFEFIPFFSIQESAKGYCGGDKFSISGYGIDDMSNNKIITNYKGGVRLPLVGSKVDRNPCFFKLVSGDNEVLINSSLASEVSSEFICNKTSDKRSKQSSTNPDHCYTISINTHNIPLSVKIFLLSFLIGMMLQKIFMWFKPIIDNFDHPRWFWIPYTEWWVDKKILKHTRIKPLWKRVVDYLKLKKTFPGHSYFS